MQRTCHIHSKSDALQPIQSICLQEQCKQNRLLCFFCIHTQHQNHQMIFLKKQFSPSIFQFYQNLQKRQVEGQNDLSNQSDRKELSKTNDVINECDQLKNLIDHQLLALKNQYIKITKLKETQISTLTPQKFIENIYQNQEIIEGYVAQIIEFKAQKLNFSQHFMVQLRSDYLEAYKKLHRFSKNILQSFKNKCNMTNKIIQSKRIQKENFIDKIDKMVQNRDLNYFSLGQRLYCKQSNGNQIIDLDYSDDQGKIDFVAQIQKNYLKRLKTKSILKNCKQIKLQISPKTNDKIKKIVNQGQKLLHSKKHEVSKKQQSSHKKKHNQKKKEQKLDTSQFADDLFGIPKISTTNQTQIKQKQSILQEKFEKINIVKQNQIVHKLQARINQAEVQIQMGQINQNEVQMGQIIINDQKNPQQLQFQAIQQESNQNRQKQVNQFQAIRQNISLQPNSFSQNSDDNTKNQITKIIDEQNQRQNQILKMGIQQEKPIVLEDMPHRLFSVVIQNQIKFQQMNSHSEQIEDISDKNSDQIFEPSDSQQSMKPKRRGRPPTKKNQIEKCQKIKKNIKSTSLKSSKSVYSQSDKTQFISIKKVVLQCYDHQEIDKSLKMLNKKEVKQLYISTDCMESAIDQETVNIIIQMKNLEKLHIYPCSNIQEKLFLKIIKNLKKLNELVLHQFNNFSLQCADYIVKYLPNLEKISFASDYMSHMPNIQDNYQFLNSFIVDSTFKKCLTLSNLNNLRNLSLINVGFLISLQAQAKKMTNKMKNLKELCLVQTQTTKPVNYQSFFQHLSKNKQIKLNSIILQNILFFETNLIQILSQSQQLHTFMIHECPKQFGNKTLSALAKYCKKLQQLSLFENDTITGQQIFELKQLKLLSLRGTWGINKEVFSQRILKLRNLQRLLLSTQQISKDCNNFWLDDNVMKIICHIENLKALNIDFTKVTDSGVQNLGKLQNLQTFICGNTQITMEKLVKIFKQNTMLSNSMKKLGLNKTKIQLKLSNKTTPHDINVKKLNCQLLNTLGNLLPNLTHIALEGVQKIFKENIVSFTNLKCIRYNEGSLTNQAEEELNRKWVFLNQNPW